MSPADVAASRAGGSVPQDPDDAPVFEESPLGIVRLDVGGAVRRCNDAFCRLVGRGRDALVGRAFADAFAAEDRDDARALLAKLVMGTARRVAVEGLRLADGERSVALWVAAVERDSEIAELLAHLLDITERRELERRFAHAQKLQALGQFAGSIAHDFNNLVAGMLGSCDLLLSRGEADDAAGEEVRQIRADALRARDLVRQLLAFARRQPLRPVPVRLDRAVDQLVPLLRRLLGPAVAVEVRHEGDIPPVRMDPGQFDQVLVNLCVNARDAMPRGGRLTLSVGRTTLAEPLPCRADIIPAGRFVVVDVTDTGCGIPREIIDDIFQPFFTTKPTGEGTGLGLATVWGIVRQSGGHVVVESEQGVGTGFRLLLPEEPLPAAAQLSETGDPVADRPGVPEMSVGRPGDPAATVLLVEDGGAVRRFAARALRGRGYRVIEAEDGEGAVAALNANPGIDVLLVDLALPDVHGTSVIAEARRRRPDARVIVMSGELFDAALATPDGGPPAVLLPKPFTLAELVARVGEALAF